jgi:hypothetical protein
VGRAAGSLKTKQWEDDGKFEERAEACFFGW